MVKRITNHRLNSTTVEYTLVHAYTSFVIRNIVLHLAGTFWDLYQDVCNHREIRLRFSFHIYASLDYGRGVTGIFF